MGADLPGLGLCLVQAGANTVINPVSFTGLLLASSLDGPDRADFIADLATSAGRVELRSSGLSIVRVVSILTRMVVAGWIGRLRPRRP